MKAYKLSENVIKYSFGNPISTEAVVALGQEILKDNLDYFKVDMINGLKFNYKMLTDAIVLGLGQNQRGINKRGGIYEAFCSDDPLHTPDKKSLYGAHNFLVIEGKENFGVFVDYPGKAIFDVGFTHKDYLEISLEEQDTDIYIIKGEKPLQIVREFLNIIGEGYAPPKWAFGYQQSRWSYATAQAVRNIGDKFIENKIPCDAIYLDIDYMERFKDFTIDNNAFPNFKDFVEEMKDKGFRLIPIIDAGVKIEKDYEVYEEGVQKEYFCSDEEGKPFVAAVWPGRCHFPDFLNPKARQWFGIKYKVLTDAGIEGFWNDMNEPAIFYTDRGLAAAIDAVKKAENENLDIYSYFDLNDKFNSMSNNLKDYKSFYHNMDGKRINHYKVHNLYGYNMTRSAGEGLREINSNKRFLLFSRASYIGMHRYSGIWTGDNHSWWEHILLNIKMMPSLNMCGFLYIGADTGGFSGASNNQLAIRWTQFSVFTPLFRNHSSMSSREQEPYSYDNETVDILRSAIELRYALVHYIYSEYMKAVINKDMYFKPLCFEYEDEVSKRIENQLLVGDSLMVTPIYEENSVGRYVYLPEDMLLWKAADYNNRVYEVIKKGHHYINVEFKEVPIFIRKNKIVVLGKHSRNVETLNMAQLNVIAFVEDKANYIYYYDDGTSMDYKKGKYNMVPIYIEKQDEDYLINVDNTGNTKVNILYFEIVDVNGKIHKKTINI